MYVLFTHGLSTDHCPFVDRFMIMNRCPQTSNAIYYLYCIINKKYTNSKQIKIIINEKRRRKIFLKYKLKLYSIFIAIQDCFIRKKILDAKRCSEFPRNHDKFYSA